MIPLRRTKDFDDDDEVALSWSNPNGVGSVVLHVSSTRTVPELRADATRLDTVIELPNFLQMFFRNLDWDAAVVVVLTIVGGAEEAVVLPLPFFGVLLRGLYL